MDDELEGSQKTRIDKLWATLDSNNTGRIDVKALQAGLRKIDHREAFTIGHEVRSCRLTSSSSPACGWLASSSDTSGRHK